MRTRIGELMLAAVLVTVGVGTAEAAVIASPTSPAGLVMTALLALALGWRLVSRPRRIR